MKKLSMIVAAAALSLQSPTVAGVVNTDISAQSAQAEQLLFAGKLDDAAKLYKPLIKAAASLGDTEQAARIYDDYGWLLQTNNKLADSMSYAQKALAIRKQVLPPNAPELANSYEHIGELYETQRAMQQALDNYALARDVRAQGGAEQAIQLGNVTEQMAIMNMKLGNTAEATRLFNQSLNIKAGVNAQYQRYTNQPAFKTQFYRYALGAPNCSRQAVEGESLATIDANGITVQASVAPAADFKGMQAFVRVINNGADPVDFLPEPPVYIDVTPSFRISTPLDTEKIATDIERKGARKANMIRFFQGDAMMQGPQTMVTTNATTRNQWGYAVYPNGQWGAYPIPKQNYQQTTMVNTMVPDWEARARAEAKAQAATQKASNTAALLRSQKLLATTLPPGQMVQGSVLFDSSKATGSILRIPVGNAIFEFPIEK
jgi:hypothetical protein